SSRRRHTIFSRDWSSDVCSSDLDKLVGELAPRRGRAETPFFQVVFALQPAPPALALPGLVVEYLDPDRGTAKFDLSLAFHRTARSEERRVGKERGSPGSARGLRK